MTQEIFFKDNEKNNGGRGGGDGVKIYINKWQNADLDQGPGVRMTLILLKKGSIFTFFCHILKHDFFIQESTAPENQYWKVKPNVLRKMMRNSASAPEPDSFENTGQNGSASL